MYVYMQLMSTTFIWNFSSFANIYEMEINVISEFKECRMFALDQWKRFVTAMRECEGQLHK
jgi:hypothetical protein